MAIATSGSWHLAELQLAVAAGTCKAPLIDGDNVKYLGSDRPTEKVPLWYKSLDVIRCRWKSSTIATTFTSL